MKRIIAIILALILLSVSVGTVNAETTNEPAKPANTNMIQYKLGQYLKEMCSGAEVPLTFYEELFTHRNDAGEADWVLIHAYSDIEEPWVACSVFNHRITVDDGWTAPFNACYGLYDYQEDMFFDLTNDYSLYDKYTGLSEVIDRFGPGRLSGDIDRDNEISIIDATIIQRCLVEIMPFPEDDELPPYSNASFLSYAPRYYSDFNRDGERTILDATAIQRHLVGLTAVA